MPLLLVKGLLGLLAGVVVLPILLVAVGVVLTVAATTLLVPLLPFAAIAVLVWLLVRASRPAAA